MSTTNTIESVTIENEEESEAAEEIERNKMMYKINDVPPWYFCIFLGLQHYLTMFGATIILPLLLAKPLCMGENNVAKAELLSTIFFVSGLATLLQSTLGSRLPIVQGGTFSFLSPTLSLLALDKWKCPVYNGNDFNSTITTTVQVVTSSLTTAATAIFNDTNNNNNNKFDNEVWQIRMREVQGAIIVASLFEVLFGFFGLIGLIVRYIGPLVITPTLALVGLSLFETATNYCEKQWWISILTILTITICSQLLTNCKVPIPFFTLKKKCFIFKFPLFKSFPVLFGIIVAWTLCAILTKTNVFPKDPNKWGNGARTDLKLNVLYDTKWFRFPYPGQWGLPTVSVAGVFGILAGVLASMVESVGDYYACARLCQAPPPPVHALNRGILMEGVGCVLAGLWGSGNGTTSYSENIGAIGITKIASRRVVQFGAIFMLIFSLIGKFGAVFVTIPDPIVGGVFCVTFGMVTAVGLSNLQFVDLNSTRNLFILGFSLFFGLALPKWLESNPNAIGTGEPILDQILTVLLKTSMFVGGFIAFCLDNMLPGTARERGLKQWRDALKRKETSGKDDDDKGDDETYNLPFIMKYLERWKWTYYVPFSPTFHGWKCKCCTGCMKPPTVTYNMKNGNNNVMQNKAFENSTESVTSSAVNIDVGKFTTV